MLFIGLAEGLEGYSSYSGALSWESTSVYGQNYNYDRDGIVFENVSASVKPLQSYNDSSDWVRFGIELHFDFEVENPIALFRDNQRTGMIHRISGSRVRVMANGKTIRVQLDNVMSGVKDVYVMLSYDKVGDSEPSIPTYQVIGDSELYDYSPTEFEEGEEIVINILSKTGDLIDVENSYLEYTDEYNITKRGYLTGNNSTIKSFTDIKAYSDIELFIEFEEDEPIIEYDVVAMTEGYDYSPKKFEEGQTIDITISGIDSGKKIDEETSYLEYLQGVITRRKYIDRGSNKFTNIKSDGDIELYVELLSDLGRVYLTGEFENCYCNYEDGEMLEEDKPIKVIANSGYEFKEEFSLYIPSANITRVFNNETTHLEYEPYDKKYDYELNQNYRAVKKVEEISSFTNIYNPSDSELNQLAKERFVNVDGIQDLGVYITNLFILPYDLPSDLLGDRSNIILGESDTRIESTLLNSYEYIIDLGKIEVTGKYNNVYDYINTNYILHLPFFNKIYLNSEYVVDETISLELVIDLYSGVGVLNVYSSFTDEIIETRKETIVTMIPFIQSSSNNVIGSMSRANNFMSQAFIEVVRNRPYNVESIFGGETIEYGRIGEYEEFIKCDNIVLNTKASNQEKEEIKQLLQRGVII